MTLPEITAAIGGAYARMNEIDVRINELGGVVTAAQAEMQSLAEEKMRVHEEWAAFRVTLFDIFSSACQEVDIAGGASFEDVGRVMDQQQGG